ncbi:PAS domain S-box protein [Pseudothauera nasutitermitis]|uniref:histidine kinase n=1 Tax=Pseudothauera nasutitermitis TaxID=2565930 RepID=A0A4S4AVC6_9RHOO|nr:PAS-domain containing protein [Pseudothauera nasutitermitis]THF63961.1 PAS domain S-box protein [Pseudothauera nasutitermitis]
MAKPADPFETHSALTPEQRRRYDLLLAGLDLLDQAIAVFDATPKLVTWNQALQRLLDFPESLLRVGLPFEELVRFNAQRGEYGEGDVEQLVAERMASARAFEPHYVERARPNGQVLAVRGVPIPNLGFISLWTDVTEQRRAEALIQQQNVQLEARVRERTAELEHANREIDQIAGALRLSEERMRLILDAIPAMIAHIDAGQRYLFANRAYAEWFGETKQGIVGRSIAEMFGAEAYATIRAHLEQAEQGERVSYEYARKNAEGRTVHARSVVVPDVSLEGGFKGYFVLSIDITEQKASQAALIQAQKMEAIGQLTGGLAHDFNNLLSIIIGNLAALKERQPAGGDPGEYLDPALHAARRGAELIKRLLTFARGQTLEPRAVEVGALVLNMSQLLTRTLTENVQVSTRLPEQPLHAFVDPHQLENALLNLAINARDAMPAGGELRIAVMPRHIPDSLSMLVELPVGDYVQFDVTDTGCGIQPEALARVFEPFFTTKPFGHGSGLGLSMVYGFVRQSGGNIRVRSTPGTGTTVTFVLPQTGTPADEPAEPVAQPPARVRHSGPVLLVEDEAEVRRIIRLQLTELGYPVIEAPDGREALALLENVADIAFLVSDTVMPGGLDGRELAARARALRPALPILLITGYARDGHSGESAEPDVPVLRKPFDRAALAEALHQLEPDTARETAHP